MGKYDVHIDTLKKVKFQLPMTEDEDAGKSRFICDNIMGAFGVLPYGDPVGEGLQKFISYKINHEFGLEEFLGIEDTSYEYRQEKRQEFLDELIAHYERLNEE